jgi:5'-nucleotidase
MPGKRHSTKPGSKSSVKLKLILTSVLDSVSSSLKAAVAKTEVELDLRSQFLRTAEACLLISIIDTPTHIMPHSQLQATGSQTFLDILTTMPCV